MIQVKIIGPNKSLILDRLRNQYLSQREKAQSKRQNQLLKSFEIANKNINVNFPAIKNEKRKNDIPKSISQQLIDKVQRKFSLKQIEVAHLFKLLTQKQKHKKLNKTLSRRKINSSLEMPENLHHSNKILKIIPDEESISKKQAFSNYVQKNLSLKYSKRPKQIDQLSKSMSSKPSKQTIKPRSSSSSIDSQKQKTNSIRDLTLKKNKMICIEKLLNGKISPSICRIKRIKTQNESEIKNHILKKIRQKQTVQQLSQVIIQKKKHSLNDQGIDHFDKQRTQNNQFKRTIYLQKKKHSLNEPIQKKNQFAKPLTPWGQTSLDFYLNK